MPGRAMLLACLLLVTTACGKKGPLLYPDMLVPAAPAAVTAQQSGAAVKLQLILPDKDRAGRTVQGVAGVKINRRVIEAGQKDVCRSCLTDYTLFRTLYLDHLPSSAQRFGSRLIMLDSDVNAGYSYSYSTVAFTPDSTDGAVSPPADVRVTVPLSAPALKIVSFPTEVKLQMASQLLTAGRLLGYNLYRSPVTKPWSYQPLNKELLHGNEYVDAALERGVKYRYSARALIMLESGESVESAAADEVEGMLKDDE